MREFAWLVVKETGEVYDAVKRCIWFVSRAVHIRIVTSYGLTYKRLVGLSIDPNYFGLRH